MRFVCAGKEWDLLQNTHSGFICCPGGFSEGFPLPPSQHTLLLGFSWLQESGSVQGTDALT